MRTTFVTAMLLIMAPLVGHGEGPKLTLRVEPQVAFYPTPLRITTIVERRPENRVVVLSSPFGDSRWEVQGDQEPSSMKIITWKTVEAGEHELVLTVYNDQGRPTAQARVTVKRMAPE